MLASTKPKVSFKRSILVNRRWLVILMVLAACFFYKHWFVAERGLEKEETREELFDEKPYQISSAVITGASYFELSKNRKVCLATQTSVDGLYWLTHTIRAWSGPISVSLFTPGEEFPLAVEYISFLRSCFPNIGQQVRFKFVYHLNRPLKPLSDSSKKKNYNCSEDPRAVLQALVSSRSDSFSSWRSRAVYPQNLLRNLAVDSCTAEHSYLLDVDMVPSEGMDKELDRFLSREENAKCAKCLFITPVYEIAEESGHLPTNKSELLQLVGKKLAFPFHHLIYAQAQAFTDYPRWEKIAPADTLDVAYRLPYFIQTYEPMFISKSGIPRYDERILGYGFARSSQVYELYLAGYEFIVLNNAFLSHWGVKPGGKLHPKWRRQEIHRNSKVYQKLMQEWHEKYPETPERKHCAERKKRCKL